MSAKKGTVKLVRDTSAPTSYAVELIRGDTITPEPILWLCRGWLAKGKLHIVAGAPGTGKTTIALAFAAAVTTGVCWPNRETTTPADVLIWSGEDSIKDTLVPRLMVAGANLARINFVGQRTDDEGPRPFDPATDFDALALEAARLPELALVIVDPIVSAILGDSHKNAEVRRGLQPLVTFAEGTGAAILGISHFSKSTTGRDPTERITGSLAFGAVARAVFAAVKEAPDKGGERLLVRAKSNIGPDGGAFRYGLRRAELDGPHAGIEAMRVEWLGEIHGEARDILNAAEVQPDPADRPALDDAVAFLVSALEDGPVPIRQLQIDAKSAGIAQRTLERAKATLMVRAAKGGMAGGWQWSLPPKSANPYEHKTLAAFGEVGGLRSPPNPFEGRQENTKAANKTVRNVGGLRGQPAEDDQRARDGE